MNFLNAYFGEYKLPEIFKKFATSEITSTFYDNLYSITFLKEFKKNKYSGFPNGYLEMFDKTKFVDKDLYFKTRFYHNCAYSYFLYNAALNDSVNAFESDKGFRIAYKLIKENCSDNMKYDLLTHLLEWNVSKKLNTYDSLYHDFSSICFNEIYINYLDKVVAREQKKNKQKELLTEQIALKSKILSHTPDELGMDYTLWNSKVVQEYIESNYLYQYNRRSIRKIMNRLGFTSQKPIKLAYQRNPEKIKEWLTVTYPEIKSRAMKESARIYWGDEMGIQSTDNRGKTYGLKGKTPAIKRSGSRFKCNMLAAISPQGFMNWMVFEDNFTSKKCIEFLGRLIRQIKQKIFLILDRVIVEFCV